VSVTIGIAIKSGDLAQAVEGFERLGLSSQEAGAEVAKLGDGVKAGGDKIAAATIAAAASLNRFADSAESNSARAGKAADHAAAQVEALRRAIKETEAAGGPVSPEAIANLRKMEDALDANIRRVADYKNVQDEVRDKIKSARTESDLQRGSINDVGDVVERLGPKWADMLGKVSAGVGTFTAFYAATRKAIEGLKEFAGLDVDAKVQGWFRGLAEWTAGVDENRGAVDRLRNAQNILKHQGIDPAGKSLAELDALLEANSRKTADNAEEVEEAAKKAAAARKKAAEEAAAAEARAWEIATTAAQKAAEAQRTAGQAAIAWVGQLVAAADPVLAAEAKIADGWGRLQSAIEAGLSTEKTAAAIKVLLADLDRALDKAAALEVLKIKDAPAASGHSDGSGALEAARTAQEAERALDAFAAWAPTISMAGEVLSRFDADLGRGVQQAAALTAQVVQAYKAWTAAGSKQGFTAEGVAGGAATGSQIGGMGQSFGWWSGDRGSSQFGGKRSGDYGDIGSTIGGALGSFFGPIGGVIGGLLGGVLGGLVKSGADEGLATLRQTVTGVAMMVGKDEGGLGDLLRQVGTALDESLRQVLGELGANLLSIPEVSFKIRDDTVKVWVGSVERKFKDLGEATSFALQEILRQGEFSGIGPAVKQALESSYGQSLERLGETLDFAQYLDDLRLDDVGKAFQDAMREFSAQMREAVDLGFGQDLVVGAFGRNLATIRDQILGISESEDERIRRQAASYNAELAILRAKEETRQIDLAMQEAELEAKVATLAAEGQITTAGLELARERVRAHAAMVEVEGEILGAEAQMVAGQVSLLGAALFQLAAVQDALAASRTMLDALPQLISDEEIRRAIDGLGNVGGGWSAPSGSAGPSPAEEAARAEEERRRRAAAARDEALGAISSFADDGWFTKLRKMYEANNALRATYDELGMSLEEVQMAEFARQAALREEAVGSLGLASDAIRRRYDQIGATLAFLSDHAAELALSAEEFGRITSELGGQLFTSLAGQIAQAVGDQDALLALQRIEWQVKLANWQLEIERLRTLGVLTEEQLAELDRLLGVARAFDPTTGGSGATGGAEHDAAYWAAVRQEEAAQMQQEAAERMARAIAGLIDFQRSLFLDGSLSPLTGMQRLGVATDAAQAAVAALAAMGPNDARRADAISALPDVLRSYLAELANAYGTASSQYADGFAWVARVLAGITGQNIVPFPLPGSGGGAAGGGAGAGGGGLGNGRGGRNAADVLPFRNPSAIVPAAIDRNSFAGIETRIDATNSRLDRIAAAFEGLAQSEREAANETRRRFAGVA